MANKRQSSTNRLLLLLVALFLGLGLLALLVPEESTLGGVTRLLWGMVPISVALWQYTYNRIERHRLWVNRVKFWLTNPESTWGLTCEFDVANGLDALSRVNILLRDRPRGTSREVSSSSTSAVWQLDGLTMRVVIDVADDPTSDPQTVLRLEFLPVPRAYRAWTRLIRGAVFDLVEQVERDARPSRRKYVAHVSFPEGNPYFGLFVANVTLGEVHRFEVDYFERRAAENDLVQLREHEVRVVTDSAHAAKELSMRYLALHPIETGT